MDHETARLLAKQVYQQKQEARRAKADLPFEEKLRIIERLRERKRFLRSWTMDKDT